MKHQHLLPLYENETSAEKEARRRRNELHDAQYDPTDNICTAFSKWLVRNRWAVQLFCLISIFVLGMKALEQALLPSSEDSVDLSFRTNQQYYAHNAVMENTHRRLSDENHDDIDHEDARGAIGHGGRDHDDARSAVNRDGSEHDDAQSALSRENTNHDATHSASSREDTEHDDTESALRHDDAHSDRGGVSQDDHQGTANGIDENTDGHKEANGGNVAWKEKGEYAMNPDAREGTLVKDRADYVDVGVKSDNGPGPRRYMDFFKGSKPNPKQAIPAYTEINSDWMWNIFDFYVQNQELWEGTVHFQIRLNHGKGEKQVDTFNLLCATRSEESNMRALCIRKAMTSKKSTISISRDCSTAKRRLR